MRLIALIVMAAAAAEAGEMGSITVCVDAGSQMQLAYASETLASRIFGEIGVTMQSYHIRECPSNDSIVVSFSTETPESRNPGALAYSLPFEGTHIVVFVDRVRSVHPGFERRLLAYVLVHEITHILEGSRGHSQTGIMKSRWENRDYFQMTLQRFGFEQSDVHQIYLGLEQRQSRASR